MSPGYEPSKIGITQIMHYAVDFLPWRCPECNRVMQMHSYVKSVTCVGGWIMVTPVLMPWHEPAICYRVSEADADPIELLRAMGLWEELKTRSDDKDLKV